MSLALGWQRHCVAKSRIPKKYQNHTWFTVRICRHMFDVAQNHAGGEKPERQQHIRNEHAQKLHFHTRGVAQIKTVTRTEGAKQ